MRPNNIKNKKIKSTSNERNTPPQVNSQLENSDAHVFFYMIGTASKVDDPR